MLSWANILPSTPANRDIRNQPGRHLIVVTAGAGDEDEKYDKLPCNPWQSHHTIVIDQDPFRAIAYPIHSFPA